MNKYAKTYAEADKQLAFYIKRDEQERFSKVCKQLGYRKQGAVVRIALAWFCDIIESNGDDAIEWAKDDLSKLPSPLYKPPKKKSYYEPQEANLKKEAAEVA